ncbi:GNAT family N-acetyltransferase [Mesorhizobium sp. LHD-90]|uniref:GNAT family N-acetyltransferase n=1 Tax=Mesorhizobium sp. LHD-90 TaxID=3071414 RepID=UPI0027DF0BC5|nr:GNAT family N-acetyltransferase [Mesorhizobium sp. LHD-90]MDQ6432715.1 GNAT family N-acetyltransferase [Mesorhizobium sp. LHD-90]
MATTEADTEVAGIVPVPELTTVRRFEAAGFRAWPAGSVHYDGAWAIRLTPHHPAKRLNSINPLDPGDASDIEARLERAAWRFGAAGRPLTMRLSPLGAPAISRHLDELGWTLFDQSLVMRLALGGAAVDEAMDQIPMKDVGRFVGAAVAVRGQDAALGQGLARVIETIQPEAGLFVLEQDGRPVATAVCVHDGDLAGLFEIATAPSERGNGHGRRIVLSALKWARLRGAHTAWLQVEAGNVPALGLYETIGFKELYRYHYRQPPDAGP